MDLNPRVGSSPLRIHLPTLWLQEDGAKETLLSRGASFLKTIEEVVVDGQGTRVLRGALWTSPATTAMLVPGPPSSEAGPHQGVGCLNPPPRFSYPLPSPWAHRLLSPEPGASLHAEASLVLDAFEQLVLGLQFLPVRDILLASSTTFGL